MCELNPIMPKVCSRKNIRNFLLQEFVNPSSKVEMEITNFYPLLICKSFIWAHKAPARVYSVVTIASEGLLGPGRVLGTTEGRISTSTCLTHRRNQRACAVLMTPPNAPASPPQGSAPPTPEVAVWPSNCGPLAGARMTEELNFELYFIFIDLNLKDSKQLMENLSLHWDLNLLFQLNFVKCENRLYTSNETVASKMRCF